MSEIEEVGFDRYAFEASDALDFSFDFLDRDLMERVAIVVVAALAAIAAGTHALVLGLGVTGLSLLFREIGLALQNDGFTYVKGEGKEVEAIGNKKLADWDVQNGKLLPRVFQQMRDESPDVLVLRNVQEKGLIQELLESLRDRYPHFFTYTDSNHLIATRFFVHSYEHPGSFEALEIKRKESDKDPCALFLVGNESEKEAMIAYVMKRSPFIPVFLGNQLLGRNLPDGRVLPVAMKPVRFIESHAVDAGSLTTVSDL